MSPPNFDIAPFVGPCFVLVWLSFIFYGLFVAQIYIYFATYRDNTIVKLAVAILGILETLHIVACMHVLFSNLILDFAEPVKLLRLIWSDLMIISLELVINGLVQSYYVYRIWQLSENILITVVLVTVLGARTAIGFWANYNPSTKTTWFEMALSNSYQISVTVTLSLSVFLDVSITSILLFYLCRAQSFAHKQSTRSTMHKLTYYALSTGGLTTLTTIVTLIMFKTSRSPILYCGLVVMMARVYANSMLAMLNIRQGLRMSMTSGDTHSIQLSCSLGRARPAQEVRTIHVAQETIVTDDSWTTTKVTSENMIAP